MFCTKCGAQIDNQAAVCIHCGCATNNSAPVSGGSAFCSICGKPVLPEAVVCVHCGCRVNMGSASFAPAMDTNLCYKKLAEYNKISGIVWLIIAIIQICTLVGALCGVWNIYASITRLKASKNLEGHPAGVVSQYENSLTEILIIMALNLFFGAIIGIVGSLIDLYVRKFVMDNRASFIP